MNSTQCHKLWVTKRLMILVKHKFGEHRTGQVHRAAFLRLIVIGPVQNLIGLICDCSPVCLVSYVMLLESECDCITVGLSLTLMYEYQNRMHLRYEIIILV